MTNPRTLLLTIIFAVVLIISVVSVSAEPIIAHVVVTSADENVYLLKPDPDFHWGRGQGYIRTINCKHQAKDDEPAVIILANLSDSTGTLVFGTGESCVVINASQDRGTI